MKNISKKREKNTNNTIVNLTGLYPHDDKLQKPFYKKFETSVNMVQIPKDFSFLWESAQSGLRASTVQFLTCISFLFHH